MTRATFEGPVLAGDNRFGNFRNVGYVDLVQYADMNLLNTTVATPLYGGSSGQFVASNSIPNINGTVYTPSATTYPPTAATIPADANTAVYRGAVLYLPYGSGINDIFIDVGTAVTVTGGSASLVNAFVYVSNNYVAVNGTPTYAAANITAGTVGRQTLAAFTAAQLTAQSSTSGDITNPPANGQGDGPNASLLSQVVFTVALGGSALLTSTSTAGVLYFTVRYTQLDGQIGTKTTYPYGNFQ